VNPGRCRLAAFGLLAFALSALSALSAPPLLAAAKWKDPTEAEKAIVEDPAQGLVGHRDVPSRRRFRFSLAAAR